MDGDLVLTDGSLLRDASRAFLRDLMRVLNDSIYPDFDFAKVLILSDEILAELKPDRLFANCLAFRIPWTEEALRKQIREAMIRYKRECADAADDTDNDNDDDDEIPADAEITAALYDDDLLAKLNVGRSVVVPLVFLEGDEIDDKETPLKLYFHCGHFVVEELVQSAPHAVFLQGGPEGEGRCRHEDRFAGLTMLSFQCPAFGLAGVRLEDFLAAEAESGMATVAALLGPWMGVGDGEAGGEEADQRRRLLRRAVAEAPVDEGRRRLLEALLERKLLLEENPSAPDADRDVQRLLYEVPDMPTVNPASFEALTRAFFGDLMTIVGRTAVDGLDFQRARLREDPDLEDLLHDEADDTLPGGPPLFELLADIGRRGRDDDALIYLVLDVDRVAGTDERLMRRYLRLRLAFPGRLVIPIVVFSGRSTGSHCSICQCGDRRGEDLIIRLRYYAFSINGNSPEDLLDDPRPVAWALSSMMSSWKWDWAQVKLSALIKILQAPIDFEVREVLWRFVNDHLDDLDEAGSERVRREMQEHSVIMRETTSEFLDKRLGPFFPNSLRRALAEEDDPMEVFRFIEKAYEIGVAAGVVDPQDDASEWPQN